MQKHFRKILNDVKIGQGLTAGEKLVLLILADGADSDGKCYSTANRLSSSVGCSRRYIRYILRSLKEKKLIDTSLQFRDDGGFSGSVFQLVI
jgi:hypothetical protein